MACKSDRIADLKAGEYILALTLQSNMGCDVGGCHAALLMDPH